MSIQSNFKKKGLLFAAATVVGSSTMVSGLGVASASADTTSTDTGGMHQTMVANTHGQAAINFHLALNNLLREHVTTSLDATRSIVSGDSQSAIDAATATQFANSDDLSAAIGSIYGGAAQAQFSTLFKEHIVKSNAYAMAVAKGDDTGRQAANDELQAYLHQLADFFSGAIPGLASQDAYNMLSLHEKLINESTNAYAAHDYVQSYQIEREALKQISGAADALSTGIISTQPMLFQ